MTNEFLVDQPIKAQRPFSEHPLAPAYFKYIEILESRDNVTEAKRLLSLISAPFTAETRSEVAKILVALERFARDEDYNYNEFIELGNQIDNAN